MTGPFNTIRPFVKARQQGLHMTGTEILARQAAPFSFSGGSGMTRTQNIIHGLGEAAQHPIPRRTAIVHRDDAGRLMLVVTDRKAGLRWRRELKPTP